MAKKKTAPPRVMGLDVSFTATGVVVAEGRKVIYACTHRTKPSAKKRKKYVADDDAQRAEMITKALWKDIEDWKPVVIVSEIPMGGSKGARAARTMGIASGVAIAVIHLSGIPVQWVHPSEVKVAATGKPQAKKEEVMQAVAGEFDFAECGGGPKDDHIADACASILAAEDSALLQMLNNIFYSPSD